MDEIHAHRWAHNKLEFKVRWNLGDTTWEPYENCKELSALDDYLDLVGVDDIDSLPVGKGKPPSGDPQIFLGLLSLVDSTPLSTTIDTGPTYPFPPSATIYFICFPCSTQAARRR